MSNIIFRYGILIWIKYFLLKKIRLKLIKVKKLFKSNNYREKNRYYLRNIKKLESFEFV